MGIASCFVLSISRLLFVPSAASARFGNVAPAVQNQQQQVVFHHKKFHHFKKMPMKKPTVSGVRHHRGWGGYYVAGAMICTVAWPMINAALGNPEPTSEQMLQHTIGCFVPPLGVLFFLQNQGVL